MHCPAASPLYDLTVIGTGVAGLALACGAARLGLTVALVGPAPRSTDPRSTDAGAAFDARIYALAPAAVDLLERLGVWSQVDQDRAQAVRTMRVFGDRGAELRFDAFAARVERLATIVEESELLRVLSTACAFVPGITRIEVAFDRMTAAPEGHELALADGRVVRCRLLVGADGANSAVRAAAGINARVTAYRQTAVVANFACARAHDGIAWQWFGTEGVVALLPLPGRHVSLVWSAPTALAQELLAASPPQLAARVAACAGHVLGALTMVGAAHAFVLRKLAVDRLISQGVALVGDAAHVVHPLAGQGLNLGLADVSELLAVLATREPFRQTDDPVLLRRYARARAEPIGLMRASTDLLARWFESDDPALRSARNLGLGMVNAVGPLKRALIRHALG